MSEKCEKCKVTLEFPTSREVLAKSRTCPACGHTQKVEKSILYVVETLEEQVEWLSERLQVLEAKAGIVAREKPQPVPPKRPRIAKELPPVDLLGETDKYSPYAMEPAPAAPSVDLFADVMPTAPITVLPSVL